MLAIKQTWVGVWVCRQIDGSGCAWSKLSACMHLRMFVWMDRWTENGRTDRRTRVGGWGGRIDGLTDIILGAERAGAGGT